MAKVVIDIEDSESIEIALDKRTSFGSSSGNDVQIDAEGVDAFHAVLFKDESGAFWVKHIGASGSTLVNGHLTNFTKLRDRDAIELGSLKGTFFEMEDVAEVISPSPEIGDPVLEEAIKELEAKKEVLAQEVETIQATLKLRQSEVQHLEIRRKDLTTDVENQLAQAKRHETEVRELVTEIDGLKSQQAQTQLSLREFQDQKEALRLEVATQEDQLKTLKLEVSTQEGKLQELSRSETTQSSKLKLVAQQILEQDRQLEAVSASLLTKEKQVAEAAAKLHEQVALDKQIDEAQQRKSTLELAIQTLLSQQQNAAREVEELRKSLVPLETQKAQGAAEVESLEKQRDTLKTQVTLLDHEKQQHENLNAEIQEASTKLSDLKDQVRLTESRLNQGSEWLMGQERVAHELKEVIEGLHAKRESVDEECEALRIQLSQWQRRVALLEQKHGRLLGQLEQVQSRTVHLSEIQAFLAQGEELWRQKEDQMERQFVQDQQVLAELRESIASAQKELGAPKLEKP